MTDFRMVHPGPLPRERRPARPRRGGGVTGRYRRGAEATSRPGRSDEVTSRPAQGDEVKNQAGAVQLRAATDEDAEPLARLLGAAFAPDEWDAARVRRELLDAPDVVRTWLAERDGELVGTASERLLEDATSTYGYLHWVATAPSARGLGVGAAVTSAVLVGFAEAGLDRAVLDTDDDRVPAIALYLTFGFRPDPRNAEEATAWERVLTTLNSPVTPIRPAQ